MLTVKLTQPVVYLDLRLASAQGIGGVITLLLRYKKLLLLSLLFAFLCRYERILNEMLGHLERQPKNKDRRIAWLELVEPLLNAVGLLLLAHFRSIFPLFFKWMHADDDQTVLLVRSNWIIPCNFIILLT